MASFKKISPIPVPPPIQLVPVTLETIGDGKVHQLTAVDFETGDGAANGIRFRLDGKIYLATEDDKDGYRSCMNDINVVAGPPIKNRFKAVRVRAEYLTQGHSGMCDILQLTAVENGEAVLQVGTENTDDYYPSFVHWFSPEKLPR